MARSTTSSCPTTLAMENPASHPTACIRNSRSIRTKTWCALEYKLVTEGLGVNHMRLVMGTSMGAMHTWLWGYMYPDFMDALMPLASAPVEIAGRNRMLRKMVMDSITNDPEFKGGEYTDKRLKGMMPLNSLSS